MQCAFLSAKIIYSIQLPQSVDEIQHLRNSKIVALQFSCIIIILEIKPCGLGSRIRDMDADLIYWCI